MARRTFMVIRGGGGAGQAAPDTPQKARDIRIIGGESAPYARLLDIASRCTFYTALTSWVFDSVTSRACDPRSRGRRQ